jgi:hypothetical protein
MRGKSFGLRDGKLIIKQQLTCAGLQFPELSHRSSGVYCAQEFNFSPQELVIMTLRMAEEVSTQVPADDFQALEDKIYRTIDLYKSAQEARTTAERDVKRLREQLEEREEEVESLRRETVGLRKEREDIRARVEKMLSHIDHITQEQAAS